MNSVDVGCFFVLLNVTPWLTENFVGLRSTAGLEGGSSILVWRYSNRPKPFAQIPTRRDVDAVTQIRKSKEDQSPIRLSVLAERKTALLNLNNVQPHRQSHEVYEFCRCLALLNFCALSQLLQSATKFIIIALTWRTRLLTCVYIYIYTHTVMGDFLTCQYL